MARVQWDETGKRLYSTGVKKGVLFKMNNGAYGKGVAWNGLTTVTENPGGAEPNDVYADDMKYLTLMSAETYGFTIECLQYPDEFAECNGEVEAVTGVKIGQQDRKAFGFAYQTILGNDTTGNKYGHILHLVYNSKCSPSEKAHNTVNESPETETMSFECNSTAEKIDENTQTCTVDIDSTKVDAEKLTAFENIIFGTDGEVSYVETEDTSFDSSKTYYEKVGDNYVETQDATMDSKKTYYEKVETAGTDPRLPLPAEVIAFFQAG